MMKLAGKIFIVLSLILFLVSAVIFARTVDRAGRSGSAEAIGTSDGGRARYAYLLKSENGRVMLYPGTAGDRPRELGIVCADLPEEDRYQLEKGIAVENEQQLFSILEDYTN